MKKLALLLSSLLLTASPGVAYNADLGCTNTTVASGTTDVQAIAATPGLRLMGFSAVEKAAGQAEFIIRNGTSNTAPAVAFVTLAPGESVREMMPAEGVKVDAGVFVDRVSGTSQLTIFTKQ